MQKQSIDILLAEDDKDDCILFKNAIDQLHLPVFLSCVYDGEQLMRNLNEAADNKLPNVLFLDANMPRKNGFECLTDIRQSEKLKDLTVVVLSTSLQHKVIDFFYENGANYYIRKPSKFSELKETLKIVLNFILEGNNMQPTRDTFIVQP